MKQLYKNTQNYLDQNRASENCKRINIFITKEDYIKLEDLKYKYRVSISILCQIIALNYSFNKELTKVCGNEIFYHTRKMRKTCLKLFQTLTREDVDITKPRFFNNAVILFINKKETDYIDNKTAEKLRNRIYNMFTNTIDPFWEYNNYKRYYEMMKAKDMQQ